MRRFKRLVNWLLIQQHLPKIIKAVRADALTYLGSDHLYDLHQAVSDLERQSVSGIVIEAGCALGGSAIVLAAAKSKARPLYVYDVFGMIPPPSDQDGPDVSQRYEAIRNGDSSGIGGNKYYGYEDDLLDKVTQNFRKHNLAVEENNVHFLKGLFQDTLHIKEKVALAHIDGDWYESVMTCLCQIEPQLIPGGRLVIDDYDCWSGCKKAVDEYFAGKRRHYHFEQKSRLHIVRK